MCTCRVCIMSNVPDPPCLQDEATHSTQLFSVIFCFLYHQSVWQKDQQMCRWMDAQQAKLLGKQTACKQVRWDESYRKSCSQTNGQMHGWEKGSEIYKNSSSALLTMQILLLIEPGSPTTSSLFLDLLIVKITLNSAKWFENRGRGH